MYEPNWHPRVPKHPRMWDFLGICGGAFLGALLGLAMMLWWRLTPWWSGPLFVYAGSIIGCVVRCWFIDRGY